jgi:hypothetical protein
MFINWGTMIPSGALKLFPEATGEQATKIEDTF